MASYVITLASQTGWTESFILNDLPLARGFQYQHCIWRMNGIPTEWGSDQMKRKDDIMRQIGI
ncbi:MAG: hypothetical protein EBZ87_00305 [Microbacteriaceae bacterium]|nr:hypothetical protein [Microbacteriaceae bacterium]